MVNWLDCWKNLPTNIGKFSPQTFTSLKHTCSALPLLVEMLCTKYGFQYLLTSRIQNDPLEHHFWFVRQMSGSHYQISGSQSTRTYFNSSIFFWSTRTYFFGQLVPSIFSQLVPILGTNGLYFWSTRTNFFGQLVPIFLVNSYLLFRATRTNFLVNSYLFFGSTRPSNFRQLLRVPIL